MCMPAFIAAVVRMAAVAAHRKQRDTLHVFECVCVHCENKHTCPHLLLLLLWC